MKMPYAAVIAALTLGLLGYWAGFRIASRANAGVQTHPVTCTPSAPNAVTCVGDVPIDLEGRRIRLVSEPMPKGTP